jgi:AcrR family transcriptional regulator
MAAKTPGSSRKPASRVPLNRGRVLDAAVAIADERGVGAVTMREVASRLGVEAMSLYNHVANKDDILDGMVDVVIEQFDLPSDVEDWREAMRRRAVSAHEVFGRHPWAPMLLDSRQSSGPARLRYFDWVLGTLMTAGFSVDGAARAFSLIDSYVYGFGIQQFNFSAGSEAPPEEMAEAILAIIPAEEYPYLHRMASHAMQVGYDAEADFDFGLEIILDGLERILGGTIEPDAGTVREALRSELESRGYSVASDTLGSRGELYISGATDLAEALFEFKRTAREAWDTMYQGSWVVGLPPRFAVLPRSAADESEFELLEQARIAPLLYGAEGETVVFDDLDRVLAENLRS